MRCLRCAVGVDIELPRAGGARLAKRFFQPDEAALVYAADDPDREFCRLWTLKESYIKCADLRLGNIRSFSVVSGRGGLLVFERFLRRISHRLLR